MHPQIPSAIPLDLAGPWLVLAGFGAYHGLNPAMGWLFALARGLQQGSERAIWVSLVPIALGHAVSIAVVAALLFLAGGLIPMAPLRRVTSGLLLAFGVWKLFTYYRHPRWVGMRVSLRDLGVWSFLMAVAHGAGLMVAPAMLGVMNHASSHGAPFHGGFELAAAVALHSSVMFGVMALVAWVVYRKLGLAMLRRSWINFDLIWAFALLLVGGIALAGSL